MAKRRNANSNGATPVQAAEERTETRIVFNELGSSGLQAFMGFVSEAYNTELYWPGVQKTYARLRNSMPEIVMIRQAFTAWSRDIHPLVELPDDASDDDKRYQDFILSDFDNMEGGFGDFLETTLNNVPFYGWGWFEVLPSRRELDWRPPGGDEWRSEEDDGLIGIRRLAWRDPSSFKEWQLEPKTKRLLGMVQQDFPNPAVTLPLSKSLHLTFGDSHNPEGSTPLESVWRLERIKYGLEVVQGMGYEHSAGHLDVLKETEGAISPNDKTEIRAAARAIMSAQEGNYVIWPKGFKGELKDVNFQAGASLIEAIKHYSIMVLSIYMMQFVALNTFTNTGALASQTDSTDIAVTTYNSMIDGIAAKYDAQIGKRLYGWNKARFPGMGRRPHIKFSHLTREIALDKMGSFLQAIRDLIPLGEDDLKAIRARSDFLPESLPEEVATLPRQQPTDPFATEFPQRQPTPVAEMAKLMSEIKRLEKE